MDCNGQTTRKKYDCLLFDLDDTLYPLSSGIADAVMDNIKVFMVEKLGIDKSKLADYCNLLYKNYGTTLAGLRAIGYNFDYDEYHSFVHGRLPYEVLKPDPVLRNILLSLPIQKVIFTNSDKVHTAKVLDILGLADCFDSIICFETLNPSVSDHENDQILSVTNTAKDDNNGGIFDIIGHFSKADADVSILPKTPVVCKPLESAIEKALVIGNIDPRRTLFFEDSVRNIQAGKQLGLDTILVGKSQKVNGADYVVENIHNLREAVPELWECDTKTEADYPSNVSVETSVTA